MSKKNQKSAKSENSFFMQGDQKIIVGTKLEAKDFSGEWYPARVVKIKSDEKMILVHFERWSSRFDIWLPFNSDQIRMLKCNKTKEKKWRLGDRIVAKWGPAAKMYPATISKFVSESTVEITFYDGIKKNINKASLKSDTEKLYRQFCFGLPRKQIIASNKLESSSEQSRPSNKGKRKLSETTSKSDLIKSDLHLKKPFKSQNLLTDAVESNNDLKQISSSRTSRNNSLCSSHIKPLQNLEQKEKLLSEKKHCIQYMESAKGNEINFSDNSLKCIAYKSQILTSKLNIFPKSSNSVAIMKKNAHEYVMFPVVSEEEKIEKKNFNDVTQLLSSSENDKLTKIKDCQEQVKSVKHHITTLLPTNESGSVLLHSNEYDSVLFPSNESDSVLLSSNESDSVLSNYIPLNIHEISIPHENQLTNCSKTTLIKKLPSNIESDLLESIKENCSLIKSFDNGNETPKKIKLSEINTLMKDQTLKNKDQTLKIKDQTQVTNNGDPSTKQLSSDDDQSTIQESNNVTQSSLQLSSDCNQITLLLSSRSNPTTLQIPVDQDQLILQIPKSDQLGLQSSNIGVQSTLKILNDSNKSNKDETSTFQVLNSSDQSNQGETLQVYNDCDQSIVCDKLPLKKCNYCDQSNNGNQPSLQISSHCDLLNDSYQSTLQISNNWDQSNSDIPLPLQLSNNDNHSNVDQLTIQVSNDCDQSILLVSNKGELATSHLSNNSNQLNKINDDHVSNNCKQLTSRLLNDEQIKLHVPEGFNQTTLHVLNDGEQITKKHLVDHNVINMKNSFKPLFNKSKLVSADSFQQRRSNRERKEKKFIDDIDHKINENIKKGLLDASSVNEVTSAPQSNCKTKTKINLKSKPDTKIKNEIASPKFEEQVPLNENKETSISEVCKKKIKTSVLNKEVPANFKKQRKCKKFEDKYELFKKKWKEEKEKRRKIQNDSETTDNHFFDKKKENNKSIDILEENDKTSDFKKLTPFSNDELGLETKTNHESILLVKVNNNSDEEGKIKVPVFQSKLVDESVPENNEFVLNKVVDEMDLNAKNLHSKDLNIAYNNSDFLDIVCNSNDKKILASNLNNEFNSSCVKPKRNRGRPAKVKVGIINNDINKLLGIKRKKQLSITKDSCTPGDTMSMASMVSKIPFYVKKQVTPMLHSENADKSPLPVSNILSKQPPESSSFKTINQSLIYREDSDIKHSRSDSNNAEVSVSNIAVENAFVLQKESDESIIVIQQSLDEVENSNHFSTNDENINNRDFSAKNFSEKSYDVSDKLNEINLTDIKLYGKKNEPKLRNRKFSVDFIAGQLKSKHKLFQKKCHLLQKRKSMNIPLQKKFSKAIKSKKLVKKSAINIVNDMSKKLKSKNIKKVSMYSSSFVSTLTPQQYSQEKQNDNNDVYSASIENKFLNLNDGLNMLPELKVQMHSVEDMCFDVIGMKNKGLLKISNTSVCGNTPVCDIKTESDASQLSTNIQQVVYKKCYNDDSGDNKICNRSMVSSKDSKFDSKQQQKKQRKNKMLQKCEKKIQMRHAESSVSVYTPVVSLKEDVEVSPVDIEKLNLYESTETESESEGELPSVDDCVKCLCEDDCELGFMIQCEQCLTWQHGECVGYAQPKDVPLFYLCHICSNPKGLRSASMFDNDYTWYRHGYLPPVSPPVTSHPCVPSLLVDQENKDVLSSIMMITHAMITELFVIREIHQEVRNRCLFYGHQDIQKDLSLNHTRDHSFIEENGINTSIYGNHDNVSPNSINMLKVCSMENIEESQIDHKTNGFYNNKNDKSKQMRSLNEVYSEVHYQSKSISNQIKNNNNGKIEFDESLDSANGTNTKIDLNDNLNLKNLSMQHGLSMLEFFHNCQYNSDTKKYLLTQYKLLSELESIEKTIDLRLKLIDKKLSEIEMEYDIINQKTVLNEIVGVTNLSNLLSYLHSRKWNRVIDVISSIQEI
ncbi:uncharacterized protein LOC101240546 isoform X2 [Hydra vulgaris]|uniref:uncharacterized protein LOC101240546 isoform X2 n=1 Tax=Hydra vulgaris TaxID=6087 RepID=UPI001F5EADFD|nr:uncharacterized protein LOC101240546 isoform X2 [Hydra vulgaris]